MIAASLRTSRSQVAGETRGVQCASLTVTGLDGAVLIGEPSFCDDFFTEYLVALRPEQ